MSPIFGPARPKGAKKTVLCNFPPLGVLSAKTQSVKKIGAVPGRIFWGGRIFFSKGAPSSEKIAFLCFEPGISPNAKGLP